MSILLASRISPDLALASHPFIWSPDLEPQWWFTLDIESISKINPKMHWVWYNIRSLVYCTFLPSQILQLGRYLCIVSLKKEMAEDLGPVFFFDFDVTFRLSDSLVVSRSFFKSGMWNSYTPHRKDRDVKKTLFCGGMGETWQSEGWSNSTPGQLLPRVFGRCRVLEDDVLGTCLNDDCLVYDFRCGWNSAEKNVLQFGHFFRLRVGDL